MEIVGFYRNIRTEHLDMVTKPTNAHKYIKVFCIINIVFLLHISATLVAFLKEMRNKEWIYLDLTKVYEFMLGCEY
jgi:hypothetical protein